MVHMVTALFGSPIETQYWALDRLLTQTANRFINWERRPDLFARLMAQVLHEAATDPDIDLEDIVQQRLRLAAINAGRRLTGEHCDRSRVRSHFDWVSGWLKQHAGTPPTGWHRIAELWIEHALAFCEQVERDLELVEDARTIHDFIGMNQAETLYDNVIRRFRFAMLMHRRTVVNGDVDVYELAEASLDTVVDRANQAIKALTLVKNYETHGDPTHEQRLWQYRYIPGHTVLAWLFAARPETTGPSGTVLEMADRLLRLLGDTPSEREWWKLGHAACAWAKTGLEAAHPHASNVMEISAALCAADQDPLPIELRAGAALIIARTEWSRGAKADAVTLLGGIENDPAPGGHAARAATRRLREAIVATIGTT